MQTSNKNRIIDLENLVKALDFDPEIDTYKQKLLRNQEYEKYLCVGNQYLYIVDFIKPEMVFISPGVKDVLGHEPEKFYDDLFFMYEIIHPDDRPLILKATAKCVNLVGDNKQTKPLENAFLMDYRVKKADGNYIRILRQTSVFSNDKEGNMTCSIGICTDITEIKKSNKIEFSMTGPAVELFDFPDDELKQEGVIFSKREKEVLGHLMRGKTSKEIAELLFISPSTVISHRKNMMEKTDSANCSELIAQVVGLGLDK